MKNSIKWVGITGSWRKTNSTIENDVRECVRDIVLGGDGIVTGGALNVDYQATDEVLKLGKYGQIKVFLPVKLDLYTKHYRNRAKEGVITSQQAEDLITQLTTLYKMNPEALVENQKNTVVDKNTYYERNSEVVNASDKLIAFQVNESLGVQDTVDKAREKGMPVKIYSYQIPE
jgi:hypothetical protein